MYLAAGLPVRRRRAACVSRTHLRTARRGAPGAPALPCLAGYNPANPGAPRLVFGDQFITSDIDDTYGNGSNFSQVETYSGTGTIDWDLAEGLAIKSITAYRKVKADLGNDIDGSPILIGDTRSMLDQKQFSQELQVVRRLYS